MKRSFSILLEEKMKGRIRREEELTIFGFFRSAERGQLGVGGGLAGRGAEWGEEGLGDVACLGKGGLRGGIECRGG